MRVTDVEMDAALRTWQQLARANQAEAERLRVLADGYFDETVRLSDEVERLRAEVLIQEGAVAEVERLRAALEEIADLLYGDDSGINIAARALGREEA
jgi:hypothetical protein